MTTRSYAQLVRYKQWADRGLLDVVGKNLDRLNAEDATLIRRILDHIHVVDRIFLAHLRGQAHDFHAARSDTLPDFRALRDGIREVDAWYAAYVDTLSAEDFEQGLDLVFTSGKTFRMTRAEIVLHVCTHGLYHRGNAGVILQKAGIAPNDDRLTDYLENADLEIV